MNTAELLKSKNIRPSVIRIMIFDYLYNNRTHPTVDEIYSGLVKNVPTLSKTTVYNTLKLFVENGITKSITIEGFQTRYDADTAMHGHFLCKHCGKVYDFNIDKVSDNELEGFTISTKEVYYSGICRNCNNKK